MGAQGIPGYPVCGIPTSCSQYVSLSQGKEEENSTESPWIIARPQYCLNKAPQLEKISNMTLNLSIKTRTTDSTDGWQGCEEMDQRVDWYKTLTEK